MVTEAQVAITLRNDLEYGIRNGGLNLGVWYARSVIKLAAVALFIARLVTPAAPA
jgi:hypothetical protein